MADAMALQCRVEIQVTIMAFERNRLQIPDDLVEEPLDLEKLQKEPGMIGYVVQEGMICGRLPNIFTRPDRN